MKIDDMNIYQGAVTGKGRDDVGEFTISGKIDQSNSLSFTKQYIGQHAVEYNGTFTERQMSGKWSIASFGLSGDFQLTKAYNEAD